MTFDLSAIPNGPQRAAAFDAVNAEGLRCFVATTVVERWLVLDWQHTCYWLDASAAALSEQPWEITVWPDGDYYSFLSPDMTVGTFGHPWERTLTVFGEPLVTTLATTLATWLPVVRRSGV